MAETARLLLPSVRVFMSFRLSDGVNSPHRHDLLDHTRAQGPFLPAKHEPVAVIVQRVNSDASAGNAVRGSMKVPGPTGPLIDGGRVSQSRQSVRDVRYDERGGPHRGCRPRERRCV